jgi:glycosyltransferase involved in cell wall biosynthesis
MLVSFYIIAYNHSHYIADAIRGALSQTYSPLQIVISDDASTDDTYDIIRRTTMDYQGPHEIKILRNERNIGISRHISKVVSECDGEWIIASAGDDYSEADRVQTIIDNYRVDPGLLLIQSYLREVDADGNEMYINTLNDNKKITNGNIVKWSAKDKIIANDIPDTHGASFAYSRKLLDLFDQQISEKIIFEDNVIDWRAEMLSGIGMIRKPLVNHRNHPGQATRSAKNELAAKRSFIKKIVESDLEATRQNIVDLKKMHQQSYVADDEYYMYLKTLEETQSLEEMKSRILNSRWPLRVYGLLVYLLYHKNKYGFSKNEISILLLP